VGGTWLRSGWTGPSRIPSVEDFARKRILHARDPIRTGLMLARDIRKIADSIDADVLAEGMMIRKQALSAKRGGHKAVQDGRRCLSRYSATDVNPPATRADEDGPPILSRGSALEFPMLFYEMSPATDAIPLLRSANRRVAMGAAHDKTWLSA